MAFRRHHKDTLLPIIRAHILPGTCVMSDMWKAYDCQKDEGYTHLAVNHSLNFVDPDTGAHTERNENTWWGSNEVYLVQGHPKISSKATYRNGCGVSTMETILLETLSSISLPYMKYANVRKLICSSYHCMHCSWSDRRFMEERNKIHSFNTWE